jgi:hypothetical protein
MYDDSWAICLQDDSKLIEGRLEGERSSAPSVSQSKPRKIPFLKIGLILFPISLIINTIFMKTGVHGILRELSRLGTLVGFFLIIFGGIYSLFRKKMTRFIKFMASLVLFSFCYSQTLFAFGLPSYSYSPI